MNEKLSLQDLVDLLSKKAKITKKDADAFYRELFQLVLERIFDNDLVKIKDFGTFKLISVSSRESINVNTGEKIEIPSHFKLSFLPDRTLRDLVNKPFSQFETVLLEDGVVFESSVVQDEEDMIDEDALENEEYIDDENDDAVSDIEGVASVVPHIQSEGKESDTLDATPPVAPKTEAPANRSYTKSFVYTYTTTESEKEKESHNITLIVPKEDLTGATTLPKFDNTEHSVGEKTPENSEIALQNNNNEPEYISLPSNIVSDDLELESDSDSELETEKDIVIPRRVIERRSKEEKPSLEKVRNAERKFVYSNDDPERPLIPLEETDRIDGDNRFAEDRSILPSGETEVLPDLSIYEGYDSNPNSDSKLKKWLPIVLFFLVIVACLTYGLVKMLKKPYDYEYHLGRTNLTASDTTFDNEEDPQTQTTALLDSMKRTQNGSTKDTLKTTTQAVAPKVALPTVEDKKPTNKADIKGNADSLTTKLITSEKNGFVISDKLQFAILNKAEHYLLKNSKKTNSETITSESDAAKTKPTSASKNQYTTTKSGTTLRSIATTYYGNSIYWVYIYQTNKKNIANPNSVPVGTSLVIPSLSEYGVTNPKDVKSIEAAKNLETKILK